MSVWLHIPSGECCGEGVVWWRVEEIVQVQVNVCVIVSLSGRCLWHLVLLLSFPTWLPGPTVLLVWSRKFNFQNLWGAKKILYNSLTMVTTPFWRGGLDLQKELISSFKFLEPYSTRGHSASQNWSKNRTLLKHREPSLKYDILHQIYILARQPGDGWFQEWIRHVSISHLQLGQCQFSHRFF